MFKPIKTLSSVSKHLYKVLFIYSRACHNNVISIGKSYYYYYYYYYFGRPLGTLASPFFLTFSIFFLPLLLLLLLLLLL